jgi:hypothetical protein
LFQIDFQTNTLFECFHRWEGFVFENRNFHWDNCALMVDRRSSIEIPFKTD